jgi:hypothetical protein
VRTDIQQEQALPTIEAPRSHGPAVGATESRVGRPGRRRDEFEAVGLLLGIFGVLLILVVTVGAGTRF